MKYTYAYKTSNGTYHENLLLPKNLADLADESVRLNLRADSLLFLPHAKSAKYAKFFDCA